MSLTGSIALFASSQDLSPAIDQDILRDDAALGMCWVDGFITAVAIGPVEIPTQEWLATLFGDDDDDLGGGGTHGVLAGTFVNMHRLVLRDLRQPGPHYRPAMGAIGPRRFEFAGQWAAGFAQGILLREEAWGPLIQTEDEWFMKPILALLRKEDGTPSLLEVEAFARERGLPVEAIVDEAIELVPGCIQDIHAFWRRRDRRALHPASEFRTGKVGRNDPCPCGSGLKYKKCCLN